MNQREAELLINKIRTLKEMLDCTDSFWFDKRSDGVEFDIQMVIMNLNLMTRYQPIDAIKLCAKALKYYVEFSDKTITEELGL